MEQPNLNYVHKLADGNTSFLNEFVKIIKDEFPDEKQTYTTAVEAKDNKASAEIVHKLKHKFNILGLEKAYALAVTYEEQLLKGTYDLHIEFKLILDKITSYLKTI
ncbi:MAG: Hpt domain-containing protein [Cellulophaga sp.]|uniref:Hpt domain-containing protein n=1 Tax=unclassified Cellulophaga TaxID=2634405 RepID=UPI000C2B58B4|nr:MULTISPECIES: histidine kinase [unclassified Cellulophaga]MDO6491275.1 Hpt domain-containing protein [Cellulophaga sp. 2_MG-2023]MDO6495192.1 Hpt domain-containing protein [Cellulophaga sp. 3_MG-2023]PKB42767.1 Hpt domain-containing protein [Cellulophaga sp. RHA19]